MAAKRKIKPITHKINKDELMEEYFGDMQCLGCVSTSPYYQFAHWVNQALDKDFRLSVSDPENEHSSIIIDDVEYHYFKDFDSLRSIEYSIVCNRNKTNYLMTELPKADYIILMNGIKHYEGLFEVVCSNINLVPKLTYAFPFNPLSLKKTMDRLVF